MNRDDSQNQSGELAGETVTLPRIAAVNGSLHLPSNSRLTSLSADDHKPSTRGAVFLDRDGTIVEDVHFLQSASQLRILPGAVRAIRMLQSRFYTIVVTNQSGVARGMLTEEGLLAIHGELVRRLGVRSAIIDALYYCPHLKGASVSEYDVDCDCRKPKPGMLLRAESDWRIDLTSSFVVGDAPRDVRAGHAAGVRGILLGGPGGKSCEPALLAPDLASAGHLILAQARHYASSQYGGNHPPMRGFA